MQYITPKSHLELLSGIVAADLSTFKEDVKDCLAASFHCDASMDRTQKDNEFMLLKTIDREGKESLKYVSLGFVTGEGAQGHLESLKVGAEDTIGFHNLLQIANHMTTDGGNKNVGQHHGLWKLIEDERIVQGLGFSMWKSVCTVHSSTLAYKDLCREVSEVEATIQKISGMAKDYEQRKMLGHVLRHETLAAKRQTTTLSDFRRKRGRPPASLENDILNTCCEMRCQDLQGLEFEVINRRLAWTISGDRICFLKTNRYIFISLADGATQAFVDLKFGTSAYQEIITRKVDTGAEGNIMPNSIY